MPVPCSPATVTTPSRVGHTPMHSLSFVMMMSIVLLDTTLSADFHSFATRRSSVDTIPVSAAGVLVRVVHAHPVHSVTPHLVTRRGPRPPSHVLVSITSSTPLCSSRTPQFSHRLWLHSSHLSAFSASMRFLHSLHGDVFCTHCLNSVSRRVWSMSSSSFDLLIKLPPMLRASFTSHQPTSV